MIVSNIVVIERAAFPSGQRGAIQDPVLYASWVQIPLLPFARLAQLVERKTFNLVVVGSSPTAGTQGIGDPNSSIAQSAERSAVTR